MLMDNCDADGDGTIHYCEMYDCLVMIENEWRLENCEEGYASLYCANPFEGDAYYCNGCEGYWSCEDIEYITYEVMAYYDVNGDNDINPEDEIDLEHYDILVEYCDFNNDGTVD